MEIVSIQVKPIYVNVEEWNNLEKVFTLNFLHLLKLAKLTEVMRQQGDHDFINLLNKVRIGNINETGQEHLEQRFIKKLHESYPVNVLHMFAENQPTVLNNSSILDSLEGALYQVTAIDKLPNKCNYLFKLIDAAKNGK